MFKIVFCDENDLATEFHEYGTYETYEKADHIIRMTWNKEREDKIIDTILKDKVPKRVDKMF